MPKPKTLRARWLAPTLFLAGLVPSAIMGWQAANIGESHAGSNSYQSAYQRRQKLLAQIPKDPTVLINVKHRDMPGSPDILNLGKRSTKALERCLADNVDADNRIRCAVVMEALADRSALPTLHAALEDWDSGVRLRVVRALAAMPDASSVEPLIKLYRRKDEENLVRLEVLNTFGSISDKRVVKLLRSELRAKVAEDARDMRAAAFLALWHNRHLMARATLVGDTRQALQSDHDGLVYAATLAAAELRSSRLVSSLIPLMEHQGSGVRNKAVYALGRIGDKKATKALLARLPKVRESRMLNNIAFALERLDKDAFYKSIKKVVEHKQAIIRLNAAFVLGDVKRPEGLPMLEKALKDPSDYVRTSAIVAVGKLGTTSDAQTKRAIKMLEPFAKHSNLSVREEAVYALHSLTKGGRKDLIFDELFAKLDRRKHRHMIRRAAVELGRSEDLRVTKYLTACLLNRNCSVGEVGEFVKKNGDAATQGRIMLHWARGSTQFTELVSAIKAKGTLPLATAALQDDWRSPRSYMTTSSLDILGALGDSKTAELARKRENSRHTWTRLHSQVAQARIGDAQAGDRMVNELDNLPSKWLPDYVRALQKVREEKARKMLDPKLEPRQKDKDVNIALAAAAVRLSWFPDKAIFRFIEAIGSKSAYERNLAERYIRRNRSKRLTWLLRRALAREGRDDVKDRLRAIVDGRP